MFATATQAFATPKFFVFSDIERLRPSFLFSDRNTTDRSGADLFQEGQTVISKSLGGLWADDAQGAIIETARGKLVTPNGKYPLPIGQRSGDQLVGTVTLVAKIPK